MTGPVMVRQSSSDFWKAPLVYSSCFCNRPSISLRSRRLEVVGERENRRARGRHARELPLPSRVSFSRARFSCAHYFLVPCSTTSHKQPPLSTTPKFSQPNHCSCNLSQTTTFRKRPQPLFFVLQFQNFHCFHTLVSEYLRHSLISLFAECNSSMGWT